MKRKGFSLIELLVAMVIFAIILGIVATILIQTTRAKRLTEILGEAQEHARIATDVITYYLRQAGYNIEVTPFAPFTVQPQMNICWAGPYEVVINADIDAIHAAMDPDLEPDDVPSDITPTHYQPTFFYARGAETIRLSLDSDNDGEINTNGDDRIDDNAETVTRNPNDAVLMLQIYGETAANNNDGTNIPVAILRSPNQWPGQTDDVTPLFQYWLDPDGPGGDPPFLFGDADGDGALSIAEIQGLTTPVPADFLDLIVRINVTCIGETRNPYRRAGYLQRISRTGVVVTRNLPVAMNTIAGYVYHDINTNGECDIEFGPDTLLPNVTINLSTGESFVTMDGAYQFTVEPGKYKVTQVPQPGLQFFEPGNGILLVDVNNESVPDAHFGDIVIPTGDVVGYVYLDTLPPFGERDSLIEPGIPNIPVLFKDGFVAITDSSGYYEQEINAECTTFVKANLPDTLMASGYWIHEQVPDSIYTQEADSAHFHLSENEMVHVDCGAKSGVGYVKGLVFHDRDRNSYPDSGEPGLDGVKITVMRGDTFVNSGTTDTTGEFLIGVTLGNLTVIETDPPGYNSINSNYVEAYVDSAGDTVEVRPFADIQTSQFSREGNANSLNAPDINSDICWDICLTTDLVTNDNISVWHNRYGIDTLRPNLFQMGPDYRRAAVDTSGDYISILCAVTADFNINDDYYDDLVCGLKSDTANIRFWFTTKIAGQYRLEKTPSMVYTAVTGLPVLSIAADDFDGDGDYDIAVGTADTATYTGCLEVWLNDGSGNFNVSFVDSVDGQINAIATGNILGGSLPDLLLATKTGENTGQLVLYENFGSDSFAYDTVLITAGEANDVSICDLGEDSLSSDLDIIDGTKDGEWKGWIEIWHNQGDGTFGINNVRPDNFREIPDGAIQCLITGQFSPDTFPDIVIGLKESSDYDGRIEFYDVYNGVLPSSPYDLSGGTITGEVRAMTKADFDKDGYLDLIVGQRTTNVIGRFFIIYLR